MSPSEPTEEVSTAADVSGLIGSEHRLPRLPRDDLPAALTQATAAPDPLDNDKTAAARDQRISALLPHPESLIMLDRLSVEDYP